jgi:RNA polymerase sigma-70 factor (ECF subfamily)
MQRIGSTTLTAPRVSVSQGELRELCLRDVYRYLARRLPRPEDAEDIAAEVFAIALTQVPSSIREPRAWLIGIARRKMIDLLRKNGRHPETLRPDIGLVAEAPDRIVERSEAVLVLRKIVDRLPDDQREALILQHADGLSLAEIAVILKRSVPAVKALLFRARSTVFQQGACYFLDNREVQR